MDLIDTVVESNIDLISFADMGARLSGYHLHIHLFKNI